MPRFPTQFHACLARRRYRGTFSRPTRAQTGRRARRPRGKPSVVYGADSRDAGSAASPGYWGGGAGAGAPGGFPPPPGLQRPPAVPCPRAGARLPGRRWRAAVRRRDPRTALSGAKSSPGRGLLERGQVGKSEQGWRGGGGGGASAGAAGAGPRGRGHAGQAALPRRRPSAKPSPAQPSRPPPPPAKTMSAPDAQPGSR